MITDAVGAEEALGSDELVDCFTPFGVADGEVAIEVPVDMGGIRVHSYDAIVESFVERVEAPSQG